ncbi:MAG: hypothetical protein IIY40_07060 [Firmicutes bacterium]|nr:hypothetical protein [Bacillota bacterium]
MDYSAANTQLWNGILQLAILCAMLLLAQVLRRKLPFIRRTLMPTAVLAGFLTLALRYIGILPIQRELMEIITYHALGLGFVALALRVPEPLSDEDKQNLTGLKSGALIASCYVSQAIVGLIISLGLAFTFMPGLFKASGLLLPMGYGQGPGQANNIGSTYQALGFAGGQSYGLAIAACGFLVACLCGVVYLNYLQRKGRIQRGDGSDLSEIVPLSTFQQENELPIAESVDRFSINIALVLVVYGATYLLSLGLTRLAGDGGLGNTVSSLVWGFNFLIGALLAILTRNIIKGLRKANVMHRQYQNNYLLSRASGAAFDVMIIAGIAAIDFNDLTGLWVPFVLTAVAGGLWTFFYLRWICRRIYPNYYYAGFFSMFGMMTGTISSGVLLLREVDSELKTPAANNLLVGSAFAILLGGPMLLLVGIAPNSTGATFACLGICVVYMAALLALMLKAHRRAKR